VCRKEVREMKMSAIDRRAFLKRAGLGSIALGSASVLAEAFAVRALADGEATFHFAAISRGKTIGNVSHAVNMSGFGRINSAQVVGGGYFQHYDLASSPPRTIFGAGGWKAKRLVSFDPIGTWGLITAGILVIEIHLVREIPSRAVVPATLKVICNVGSGGFDTGQPEGFTLTVPGAAFSPFVPGVAGITAFSTVVADRD